MPRCSPTSRRSCPASNRSTTRAGLSSARSREHAVRPNHQFQVTYQRDAQPRGNQLPGERRQHRGDGTWRRHLRRALDSVWGNRITTKFLVSATTTSPTTPTLTSSRPSWNGGRRVPCTCVVVRFGLTPHGIRTHCAARQYRDANRGACVEGDDQLRPHLFQTEPDGGAHTKFRPACTCSRACATRHDLLLERRIRARGSRAADPSNAGAGVVPFHRRYYGVPSITTLRLHARDNAIYMQDSWKPAPG